MNIKGKWTFLVWKMAREWRNSKILLFRRVILVKDVLCRDRLTIQTKLCMLEKLLTVRDTILSAVLRWQMEGVIWAVFLTMVSLVRVLLVLNLCSGLVGDWLNEVTESCSFWTFLLVIVWVVRPFSVIFDLLLLFFSTIQNFCFHIWLVSFLTPCFSKILLFRARFQHYR